MQHLFREGRFEAGEEMCQEAAILDHRPLMLPFVSMHDILKGVRNLLS